MDDDTSARGPGFFEIVISLLAYAAVVALFFPVVVFGDRTVASAPHITFTLPEGPYRLAAPRTPDESERLPLVDPWGPGHIHEANFPYRDRAIRAGEMPLWHPHEACGNPYFAGLLPGLLFPPSYLMHLAAPTRGFDLAYLMRLVLAGWLMFLFLRVHGLRRAAAFVGGVAYLGSGYLVVGLNLWNVGVESVVPGLLLALECVASRGRRGHVVFAALMVFWILVGGNPEASFLAVAVGGVYFLIRIAAAPAGTRARRLALGILAHVAGLLLAATQLLPFLEFVRLATHTHQAGLADVHFSYLSLPAWVVPDFYREALRGTAAHRVLFYHVGALPLVLGLGALFLPGRRGLKLTAFGVLAVIGLWHYGAPGFRELSRLPGFAQILVVKYPAAYLGMMVAVLAGVGFDRLFVASRQRAAAAVVAALILVSAIPVAFAVAWRGGHLSRFTNASVRLSPGDGTLASFGWLPLVAVLVLGAAALLLARPGWRPQVLTALALGLALELFAYVPNAGYPPGGDPFQPPPFMTALKGDRRTFRVFSPDQVLAPNTAGAFGLNDIRYTEALKLGRYSTLIASAFEYLYAYDYFPTYDRDRLLVPNRALSWLGVRYVLCRGDPVPLESRRMDPGTRNEVRLRLSEGGGRVRGTIRAEGDGAALRILHMDSTANRLLDSTEARPGQAVDVRLTRKNAPAGEVRGLPRHSLVLPAYGAGPLVLEEVWWGGRPLDPGRLAQCVLDRKADYRADTKSLVISDFPAMVFLPPLATGEPPEVVLRGRAEGDKPFPIAFARTAGTVLQEIEVPAGRGPSLPLDLDFTAHAGKNQVIGLESIGRGPVFLDRFRLDYEDLRAVGSFETVNVFENHAAVPRAFGVYRVEVVAEPEAQRKRLLDPSFPYRESVILEKDPDRGPRPDPAPDRAPEVRWKHESPGGAEVRLEVDFPAAGWLVLLDNFYPGWTAEVDGERVGVLRADYTFRAVPVPAGRHEVVFRFRPGSLTLGLALSALGVILLVGFLAAGLRRR